MPWANSTVARLAAGDLASLSDEFCGAVLICSWPMPAEVIEAYEAFSTKLKAVMPPEAYIYPAKTLHCTVLTLRAFPGGPLDAAARDALVEAWRPVLVAARANPSWPSGDFTLRMGKPTLEGAAGIFRYEDVDGAIGKMRECLRVAIIDAGGIPAIGGGDRSQARPLPKFNVQPAPHLPDIVHSTALRWSAEPTSTDAALAAFTEVAADWKPLDIKVRSTRAVLESTPFMHMPYNDTQASEHGFWRSEE